MVGCWNLLCQARLAVGSHPCCQRNLKCNIFESLLCPNVILYVKLCVSTFKKMFIILRWIILWVYITLYSTLPIQLSIHLFETFIYPQVILWIDLSIYCSLQASIYLFIYISIYLSIYICIPDLACLRLLSKPALLKCSVLVLLVWPGREEVFCMFCSLKNCSWN